MGSENFGERIFSVNMGVANLGLDEKRFLKMMFGSEFLQRISGGNFWCTISGFWSQKNPRPKFTPRSAANPGVVSGSAYEWEQERVERGRGLPAGKGI